MTGSVRILLFFLPCSPKKNDKKGKEGKRACIFFLTTRMKFPFLAMEMKKE